MAFGISGLTSKTIKTMDTAKTKSQFWENEVTRLYALQNELNLKILKYKPVLEEEIKGKVIESTLYFWTDENDRERVLDRVRVLIFTDKTAAYLVDGKFFTPHAYSDGYITAYFNGLEKNHLLVDNYEEIAEQLQKLAKISLLQSRKEMQHFVLPVYLNRLRN